MLFSSDSFKFKNPLCHQAALLHLQDHLNPQSVSMFSNDSFYANATSGFTGFNNGAAELEMRISSEDEGTNLKEEMVESIKENQTSNDDEPYSRSIEPLYYKKDNYMNINLS